MQVSSLNCAMKQNGIACGLPLVLLPEGLLYCRRCNAVRVAEEGRNEAGRKTVRVHLSEAEQLELGIHGPPAQTGLFNATQALANGWIPPDSVLGKAVAAHGERWAAAMAGGDLQGKKSGTWHPS